jgi:hypothetical protein|tara:strand:- start:1293 stop:1445 length:153 start_codon:yes stop_codon:yes gene_type:complete
MSGWLVALTGFIYLYVSIEMLFKSDHALSIVYFGYALANVGLYLAVTRLN